MEDLDLAQPAIVFWERGEITRFHTLRDAIQSVMRTSSAETISVGWISTMDRHIAIDEIRAVARRFSLTQVRQAKCDTADALKRFRRLDFLTLHNR